jgi:hypothetical protein
MRPGDRVWVEWQGLRLRGYFRAAYGGLVDVLAVGGAGTLVPMEVPESAVSPREED